MCEQVHVTGVPEPWPALALRSSAPRGAGVIPPLYGRGSLQPERTAFLVSLGLSWTEPWDSNPSLLIFQNLAQNQLRNLCAQCDMKARL